MPTLYLFDGIRVAVYSRDHLPPHVHVCYGGYEALIAIQTGEMIAGDLPISVLRKINQWIRDQQIKNWLIENF